MMRLIGILAVVLIALLIFLGASFLAYGSIHSRPGSLNNSPMPGAQADTTSPGKISPAGSLNNSLSLGGIRVTVEKAVTDDSYTRVYLQVENTKNKTDIYVDASSSYVRRGNKKYNNVYASDVRELDANIPAGITEEGWLYFEPAGSMENATLRLMVYIELFAMKFDIPLS